MGRNRNIKYKHVVRSVLSGQLLLKFFRGLGTVTKILKAATHE